MLIDPFLATWLEHLEQRLSEMPDKTNLFLLIDGVFVPRLFRSREFQVNGADAMSLLFESLPACSEETRDVSPFLVRVEQLTRSLSLVLGRCSGWPMVSAIETTESLAELSSRLAAWCVVEVGDQRFNFRFPDTRRLPKIFETLTSRQRGELAGPASRWSYVARDGHWACLKLGAESGEITAKPELDDAQFAALVDDSEPEEVLLQLSYRGVEPVGLPSVHHAMVQTALRIANAGKLAQELRCDWCEFALDRDRQLSGSDAASCLAAWRAKQEEQA